MCGLDAAVDMIGGKWKVLLLWAMHDQPRRFGELRRLLPGISEKVLTQHLREMAADQIVRREAFDETVPRVEYSLSEFGLSLHEALRPLGAWGTQHMDRIAEVRAPA
ncbi:helix-turn-helix domain-containing protein [Kutzneria viridogrisea]